jgi:hypothetical protein
MQENTIMTPKSLVLSIYNDSNRDCWYTDIIHKVMSVYPNLSDDEIGECEEYAIELNAQSMLRFQAENVHFFSHTSCVNFEDACQELSYDAACGNVFFRKEMYGYAVDCDAFMDAFYAQGGKNVDCGGEENDHDDHDDHENGYSSWQQRAADLSDYASQFDCPIQRAEIRMGA